MSAASLNSSPSPLTIESTLQALTHWRNNKNNKELYPEPGIPSKVWKMFFALEEQGYPSKTIRQMFSVNSAQYKKKKQAVQNNAPNTNANPTKTVSKVSPINFCEAVVQSNTDTAKVANLNKAIENRQVVKQLKSTTDNPADYLDFTTVIIECIRPDGHRLKIHASNQSIDIIMKTFYHELGEIKC